MVESVACPVEKCTVPSEECDAFPCQTTKMYHQNRDSRCPAEFATGHSGVDSPGTAGRYMYGPFYGPKGPDGSPYGNVNPPGGGLQTFGGKPSAVALQDTVYGTRWTAPGYVGGPGLKPGSDFVYSNQVSAFIPFGGCYIFFISSSLVSPVKLRVYSS